MLQCEFVHQCCFLRLRRTGLHDSCTVVCSTVVRSAILRSALVCGTLVHDDS
jgi:hypothetical protein